MFNIYLKMFQDVQRKIHIAGKTQTQSPYEA